MAEDVDVPFILSLSVAFVGGEEANGDRLRGELSVRGRLGRGGSDNSFRPG